MLFDQTDAVGGGEGGPHRVRQVDVFCLSSSHCSGVLTQYTNRFVIVSNDATILKVGLIPNNSNRELLASENHSFRIANIESIGNWQGNNDDRKIQNCEETAHVKRMLNIRLVCPHSKYMVNSNFFQRSIRFIVSGKMRELARLNRIYTTITGAAMLYLVSVMYSTLW